MRYIGGGVGHQKTGVTVCSLFPSGGQAQPNADTEAVQDGDEPMPDEPNVELAADPSSEEEDDDGNDEDGLDDEEVDYGYVSSDANDDDDPAPPGSDGDADARQGAEGEVGLDADEFEGFAHP